MAKSRERTLLKEITNFYLQSRDFNGLPVRQISTSHKKTDRERLKVLVRSLIEQDKISLVFGDRHPNPHIKAFPDEPHEVQLEKLQDPDLFMQAYLYPSVSHLKTVVDG